MTDGVDLVRRVLYRSPRVLGLQCCLAGQQAYHEFTVQRSDLSRWVLVIDPQFVRERAGAALVCACLVDAELV